VIRPLVLLYIALAKARIFLKVTARYKKKCGLKVRLQKATVTSIDLCGLGPSYGRAATIDVLPDDILLEIFDTCRINESQWKWDRPAHVCRRWRQIIFASPCHLRIRLCCKPGTPVRKYLSCWPAFPIIISYCHESLAPNDEDNVIAALEHPNRVCVLNLLISTTQLVKLATVMQESFPALTVLRLLSDEDAPVHALPGGFLGGSAPCLQELCLRAISFPALPTLLLSARDLVTLKLYKIPPTGYISPEAIVTGLAALTRLSSLCIIFQFQFRFQSTNPHPDGIHLPPVTRAVLPALTTLELEGASDYLEDLVARIDCPQIKEISISYLPQRGDLRVAQLFEFTNHSESPQLSQLRWLDVCLDPCDNIGLTFSHSRYDTSFSIQLLGIVWRVSHVVQVFSQFSAKLSDVRHLAIGYCLLGPDIGHNEWAQFFHPFTAVQTLRVDIATKHCKWVMRYRDPAIEDVTEQMVAEVLPALSLVYLDFTLETFFDKLFAVRQLSGHPVTVATTPCQFEKRLESYLTEQDKDPYWFHGL
jgi:hypothetical protein